VPTTSPWSLPTGSTDLALVPLVGASSPQAPPWAEGDSPGVVDLAQSPVLHSSGRAQLPGTISMVLMDVTLNVILGSASFGANVTLADVHRRTNVTPAVDNVTLGQIHDRSNVIPDPTNVTLPLGGAASLRCQRGILRRCQ
jgi:hypothetical protein